MSPALPVGLALAAARSVPFWLDDPLRPDPMPALQGDARADLAIVGGGFAGLWAALEALERDPGRDVVLSRAASWGSARRAATADSAPRR